MAMRIYIPAGEHSPQSLPCMLVAPAGTRMIHGAKVEPFGDYHDETLPYAEAGMVAILYSLDGPLSPLAETSEQVLMMEMMRNYPLFRDSGAGVVNGRTAIEYALAKLPMVDPQRIYCAGHSSAGNVSLLLAAHEPKISRCIAFAAAYDVELRLADAVSDPAFARIFPGSAGVLRVSSPKNAVGRYHCPLMVFHAKDDDNVPFSDAVQFVDQLKSAQKEVNFVTADRGGHYQPMLQQGIPAAIAWLKQ
jgi:dienelactone hydrolase